MGGGKEKVKENEREKGKKSGTKGLRAAHLEISGSNALNQLHVRTSSVSSPCSQNTNTAQHNGNSTDTAEAKGKK